MHMLDTFSRARFVFVESHQLLLFLQYFTQFSHSQTNRLKTNKKQESQKLLFSSKNIFCATSKSPSNSHC